jgi:sulfatase maturation enzyme AslB (radical SAM superfamily)
MSTDCTFCPLPWNSINLRNNGDLRICCNTNSYSPKRGIMTKEDGTPYNAGKDDWNEARNAELLKEVRVSMMKGEWHPECTRCKKEEESGMRSRREYENDDWGKYSGDISLEKMLPITEEDGTLDTSKQDIEFMDIRYGNFCNLKCRMCGPTDSHKWYDDFVKTTGRTHYKDTHETIQLTKNAKGKWHTDQYDWFQDNDIYWNNFEKYAPDAKKLYIVGGEPLIIDEHQESLERLVASGKAGKIQLEYNTNLTMVPDRLVHLWEQFKQIRIGVSIDGIGDVFNYQRTPAKFDAVYKNMMTLQNNERINLKAWFAYTVTPMNVFHTADFMKWKLTESGLDKFNPITGPRPVITHHMCHSPKYYNVKVLPQYLKDQVAEHYQEHKDWVLTTDFSDKVKDNFIKVLTGIEKFMMSEDYSEEWLDHFIDQTAKLDEVRNQNILDIVPQYKELFNAHNK